MKGSDSEVRRACLVRVTKPDTARQGRHDPWGNGRTWYLDLISGVFADGEQEREIEGRQRTGEIVDAHKPTIDSVYVGPIRGPNMYVSNLHVCNL